LISSTLAILDSRFEGNKALDDGIDLTVGRGGALNLDSQINSVKYFINNSVFLFNFAESYAGAIFASYIQPIFFNTTFRNNTISQNGVINQDLGSIPLDICIVENKNCIGKFNVSNLQVDSGGLMQTEIVLGLIDAYNQIFYHENSSFLIIVSP